MGEDRTRGEDSATGREATAPSGWVTTQQAARALDISPRTVRWHIEQGNLEAKLEGEGVRRTWLVSIDSLHAFRDARQQERPSPGHYRASIDGTEIAAAMPGNPIRELADRLVEEAARASEYRVRLELTEQAASTIRAELEEARRQREEVERERDELRRELEALREPRESPESTADEQQGRGPIPDARGSQEATERPWWRRWFQ